MCTEYFSRGRPRPKQALTEIDAVISDAINFAVASGFPVLANYLRLAKSEVGYLRRTK
jgi:hypothetical protein